MYPKYPYFALRTKSLIVIMDHRELDDRSNANPGRTTDIHRECDSLHLKRRESISFDSRYTHNLLANNYLSVENKGITTV